MGPSEARLHSLLVAALAPLHFELRNESSQHGLPPGAEKHFRAVLVSTAFAGLSRVERHRLVNSAVADELATHVHAFSIQAFTPEEWSARGGTTFASPECAHGRGGL